MKKATILIILLLLVSWATGCLRKLEDLEKDKFKYKTTYSFIESYQPSMKLKIDNDVGYIIDISRKIKYRLLLKLLGKIPIKKRQSGKPKRQKQILSQIIINCKQKLIIMLRM